MKNLMDYTKEKQTKLFEKYGVFFAFSDKQFDEQKKEGIEYRSLSCGAICPKDNCKAFNQDHSKAIDEAIQQDIKENGIDRIIRRELANYECYYVGSIEDAVYPLKAYGIDEDKIQKVYNANYSQYWEENF